MSFRLSRQLVVFAVVGVINTLADFSVYLSLLHVTGSIVVANIAATTTGLVISFILNSKFTFQMGKLSRARFLGFIGVTLFGLWVLQTGIIYAVTPLVNNLPAAWFGLLGPAIGNQLKKLLPKLVATVFTLVWNYLWYSRVIFARDDMPPSIVE